MFSNEANLRSNKSFESLGINSSKKVQIKDSADARSKDGLPRPVSTLTSNRESVTSNDKLLSARVGITDTHLNFNLPLVRKQVSEKTLVMAAPSVQVVSETMENPVRIGPQKSEGFRSDCSDLNSPSQGKGPVRVTLSPKPSEKLKSKEKLASIVAKNTESRKKLSTDLGLVLERHRKSEGGIASFKHERLSSGVSQKDTPRIMQGLEDSVENYIEILRDKKISQDQTTDKETTVINPFSISQSLKKKTKTGVVVLGKEKGPTKTSAKTIQAEPANAEGQKKAGNMYIDLYKEEGTKHYLPVPSLKNNKGYEAIISDKRAAGALSTSNPSSKRLHTKSNERTQQGNAFKSASLQFSSTKKAIVSSPSYSSSIYN